MDIECPLFITRKPQRHDNLPRDIEHANTQPLGIGASWLYVCGLSTFGCTTGASAAQNLPAASVNQLEGPTSHRRKVYFFNMFTRYISTDVFTLVCFFSPRKESRTLLVYFNSSATLLPSEQKTIYSLRRKRLQSKPKKHSHLPLQVLEYW